MDINIIMLLNMLVRKKGKLAKVHLISSARIMSCSMESKLMRNFNRHPKALYVFDEIQDPENVNNAVR